MGGTSLVSRRSLLKGGLAIGALFAAGSTVSLPVAGYGFAVLSETEGLVVAAIADAFFPGDPFPVGGVDAEVVKGVDRILGTQLPPSHASAFRMMLRTLEFGTLASRGLRFSHLDRAERTEVLQVWAEPSVLPRRVALDVLKAVFGMAYFAHPRVQAFMGWRSECAGGLA